MSGTLANNNSSTNWIGAQNRSGYNYYYGWRCIDEVHVYNYALTPNQISAMYLYNGPSTATYTSGGTLNVNGSLYVGSGTLDVSNNSYPVNVYGSYIEYGWFQRTRSAQLICFQLPQVIRFNLIQP